jgi:hypothetical protein
MELCEATSQRIRTEKREQCSESDEEKRREEKGREGKRREEGKGKRKNGKLMGGGGKEKY